MLGSLGSGVGRTNFMLTVNNVPILASSVWGGQLCPWPSTPGSYTTINAYPPFLRAHPSLSLPQYSTRRASYVTVPPCHQCACQFSGNDRTNLFAELEGEWSKHSVVLRYVQPSLHFNSGRFQIFTDIQTSGKISFEEKVSVCVVRTANVNRVSNLLLSV